MSKLSFLVTILMCIASTKASAYDIEEKNSDGVTIYYNYINDGTELMVTYQIKRISNYGVPYYVSDYSGNIVIPEEVTHMNRIRKVTAIDEHAFEGCYNLISVSIPENVKSIGKQVFSSCVGLTSVNIPYNITRIEEGTFYNCQSLTSFTIPNNITSIGAAAFRGCYQLKNISIPNSVTTIEGCAFEDCRELVSIIFPKSITRIENSMFKNCFNLESFEISDNITYIGEYAFSYCYKLKSIKIPNSITDIEKSVFEGTGLISVEIPNSVVKIGESAFGGCINLKSVTIPNSVTEIGYSVFKNCSSLTTIISLIEAPFTIRDDIFDYEIYMNASLFVPKGTKEKYKQTKGWNKFVFIEEGTGGSDVNPTREECSKPTILYQNGNVSFHSDTEDVTYHYVITNSDIKSGSAQEVDLEVTYNITVYATKTGYDNSKTATATLCWIDAEPKTEGISNSIATVRAKAVMIQNLEGQLSICGVDDGTQIGIYDINGTMMGSAISHYGSAIVNTNLKVGSIVIVKIGERSIKVLLK